MVFVGLLAEGIVYRDVVVECKGLPAVMEYADVGFSILPAALLCTSVTSFEYSSAKGRSTTWSADC